MSNRSKKPRRIEPRMSSAAGKPRRAAKRSRAKKRRKSTSWNPFSLIFRLLGFLTFGLFGRLHRVIYWALVLTLWGGIAGLATTGFYAAQLPQATSWQVPKRPPNVKILALNGKLLANRGITGGEAVALSQMSPYIPQAVIAIEDRRFRSHLGIDPIGFGRAMLQNIIARRLVQGGSTLSQQLAKNMFLKPERTFKRKVQELVLAFWLETKFSKDEIIEMYLNRVYFGAGSYGIAAASRRYFGKPPRDINLAEAALLAGLLKAPSRLSPARYPEKAEKRAQVVLAAMRRQKFISANEATKALSTQATNARNYWSGAEQYVADQIMEELPKLVGKITRDLQVETTIDFDLQKAAEAVLRDRLNQNGKTRNVSQGAVISVAGNGAIRAMVGGRDYATSQFNRATNAKRQPGSAFKPFVFLTALELGNTPQTIRIDRPIRIGKWQPENYNREYQGEVSLQQALSRSINTISVQLAMEVGPKRIAKTARRLGVTSKLQANASLALGTSEVSLLELTTAYAAFANGGYRARNHLILRVRDKNGKVLYQRKKISPRKVIEARELVMIDAMLGEVVSTGTGRRANLANLRVAGKTGTSQGFRDAWFVGYTPGLITGVWLGNDDGKPTKKVTGGSLPAEIWASYMVTGRAGTMPTIVSGRDEPPVVLPQYVPIPTPRPLQTYDTQQQIAAPRVKKPKTRRPVVAVPLTSKRKRPDKLSRPKPVTRIARAQDPFRPVPPVNIGARAPTGRIVQKKTILDLLFEGR